jgi:hypothetical protein
MVVDEKNGKHNRWVQSMDNRINDFNNRVDNTSAVQIKRICNLTENIY